MNLTLSINMSSKRPTISKKQPLPPSRKKKPPRPSKSVLKAPAHSHRFPPHTTSVKTNPLTSPKVPKPKVHRRAVSDTSNLAPLAGAAYKKAPKIYQNQIFRDVYDEFGNHDRVIDTVESLEVYEEVNKGKIVTFNNKSDISTEKFIAPDESYRSVEVTSKIRNEELFEKLKELQHEQRNDMGELLKQPTIGRHQFAGGGCFSFDNLN
jgi:hypothetical protein